MISLEQLKASPTPWRIRPHDTCSKITGNVPEEAIDGICDAHGDTIVETDGGYYPPYGVDATLIEQAANMYDRLFRLVSEIDKVLDHTVEGHAVIDCECSGIELATNEAREILDIIAKNRTS